MEQMDIDNYRLTSMEEPTDEMLEQIMREAAEAAKVENDASTKKFFANIRKAASLL